MQAEKWTFGAHEAHFEPPDTMWLTFRGDTGLDEVRWAAGLFRQLAANGPVFFVGDVKTSNIGAESREYLAREAKPEWFIAAVYIGAGFAQRTMSKAINLAFLFLGKPTIEMVFVDSAGEARAWIERKRAQRAQRRTAR